MNVVFENKEAKYMFIVMLLEARSKNCKLGGVCKPIEPKAEGVKRSE